MSQEKTDRIIRDAFIFSIMVGNCPKCGSSNTHDCQAPTFEIGLNGELEKYGSDCEVAKQVDDINVAHCDDCGHLWCLECGHIMDIDSPVCLHWSACGECGKTIEHPNDCPYIDEINAGGLLVNPCMYDCPNIEECSHCPYEDDLSLCPRIANLNEA